LLTRNQHSILTDPALAYDKKNRPCFRGRQPDYDIQAGQDVADAARKVEEARVQAKAIIADANKRSADADQRLAAAGQAEQDVAKNLALARAAEKAAAVAKQNYESRLVSLRAKLAQLRAED
jgi:hypothetical protein